MTKAPFIKRLEALEPARKSAFLRSGRTPWSRQEWRWHRESQLLLAQLRANFNGTDLEFLTNINLLTQLK